MKCKREEVKKIKFYKWLQAHRHLSEQACENYARLLYVKQIVNNLDTNY